MQHSYYIFYYICIHDYIKNWMQMNTEAAENNNGIQHQ